MLPPGSSLAEPAPASAALASAALAFGALGFRVLAFGALASARWPDGVTVVAGLGKNGFIQAARYADGKWSSWRNVSPDKALGAPGLITYSSGTGHLYYTDASGEVIELLTTDMGETWS